MSPSKTGTGTDTRSPAPLELVISGERGTAEFCRLSRLIELAYLRLLAAKEST